MANKIKKAFRFDDGTQMPIADWIDYLGPFKGDIVFVSGKKYTVTDVVIIFDESGPVAIPQEIQYIVK